MNVTEALYRAFAQYRHPRSLEGCPCCTSAEKSARLLSIPLKRIPSEYLDSYAFSATTTWGSLDDYRFFLPRILELTRQGELSCNIEITLGKLADNQFISWPADQQSSVIGYLLDWLVESLREPSLDRFDSILCGTARIADIGPFLRIADGVDSAIAAKYQLNHARCDKRRLTNAFWVRRTANYDTVLNWAYEHTSGL